MAFIEKILGLFPKKKEANADGKGASEKQLKVGFQKRKLDVAQRFELTQQAFSGTMSKFRAAREITTGQLFGLKFIDTDKNKIFEERFKHLKKPSEGEIAFQIDHPQIVSTYEYGVTIRNEPYILMEYIPGTGLASLIHTADPILDGKRVILIKQMAEAIQAVHDAGFIHRDICPRNFICNEDASWLKLIDFGLTLPDKTPYRKPGNRTGTPLYMAPEIVRRRSTDRRVDIFSFGISCYRLLTKAYPWSKGDVTGKAALAHDTHKPQDIFELQPKLNQRLGDAVMKCIEPDPNDRFESCTDFIRQIRTLTRATD